MKQSFKKLLSLALTLALLLGCLPIALPAAAADSPGALRFVLEETWAVQGKYMYVYLSAENVQGLQSGTVVVEYDPNVFIFDSQGSELAYVYGLSENPYADELFYAAGSANGYAGESGKRYVSFAFALEDGAMQATDVSVPASGRVPLYKFCFQVQKNVNIGDYSISVVETHAEVDNQVITPAAASAVVHVESRLLNQNGSEIGYFRAINDAGQFADYRYALNVTTDKPLGVIKAVDFDPSDADVIGNIRYDAFGNDTTRLSDLETVIFSVPARNLATTNTDAEYPLSAFSGLEKLERVIMEFTEAQFASDSQYFTDDGIIYRWDEDENGNFLDTCKIYFIPPNRASNDIYLSDKVTGFYGTTQSHALTYLGKEKAESLVFHVYEDLTLPSGQKQKDVFSQQLHLMFPGQATQTTVQLHCESYATIAPVTETAYYYNDGGNLAIPFDFNSYTLDTAKSTAGLTQSGDTVIVPESVIRADAAAALRSGQNTLSYTIATTCGDATTVTVSLSHDCIWNDGTVTTAPTCEGTGVRTYTCTVCGKTRTETVAALGHTSDSGKEAKAPTCTETGVRTYTCTVCGTVLRTETIAATGHSFTNEITKSATCRAEGTRHYTCTVCGYEYDAPYSDSNAHIWYRAFGLTWRCSVCGTSKISTSKPGSSYVELPDNDPTVTVTDAPVTEPPATEPPVTEPPATEPPATEPPATEPPATEPPVTEPPVTEPSTTEPPVTEPPVTEPPVTEPPVTEPDPTLPTTPTEPRPTTPDPSEPTPDEPEVMLGDVNGDGRVNSADARLALRAAVGLETLDARQTLAADADGDGRVRSSDARLILRVAVGLAEF